MSNGGDRGVLNGHIVPYLQCQGVADIFGRNHVTFGAARRLFELGREIVRQRKLRVGEDVDFPGQGAVQDFDRIVLQDRVDLESSNGSIVVEDIDGPVDARTSNGRIRAERIRGELTAESSNGSIFASSVTGDCSFITSNGRIELERIEGNVSAITSNGTIRLEAVPPTDGRVVMRTSNGNIHVTLPAELSARIKLRTTNGRIHTDFADAIIQRLSFGRNWFECALNGGEAGVISARTSNGSIRFTCR